MAAAEQPLKKRKLYDPPPPSSPPPKQPPPPQDPPAQPPQPSTPAHLSHEEIIRRRRSREEIRNVFESYKRINLCIAKKDERFKSELEEAYLSLIAASGGYVSAKRLAAEYIPRYASYCPTALEAAANTVVNIHDWCIIVISRGEDIDGLAFETAKTCILGLLDICQAAASEGLASAVIQAICSAVFLNVFNFLVSSFEGKDIFDIVDQRVLKIYSVSESFVDFGREFLEEDNTALLKLSKFRALSFLRIFFSCPKNSLCAGFDLFEFKGMEGSQKGNYFLRQLTDELHDFGAPDSTLKNCLLGLVLSKDPSIKSLIFSRYRALCDSASSEVVSDVTSVLEGVFESFVQKVKAEDIQLDSLDGNSISSRSRTPRELLNRQSFSPRSRTPRDFRSNSFTARSPVPNTDLPSPALRSANSPFDSPRQNIHPPPSSTNLIWYSDGDQAAMDIYPASKQLRVEAIGPDATEMLLRYQFEKFGFIEHLRFLPFKGFATIEYRNIMDALKAREVMRGHSPWGRIKFLDTGLGTRGAINGTAVGSSCHIFVGNVSSIWAKDEVMHEVKKVLHKGPRMVFDIGIEGALLMEFDSPEEAAMMIGHLRWYRRENQNSSFFRPPNNSSLIGSPHAQNMKLEKPPESNTLELNSPRISQGNSGPMMQTWMYGKPENGMRPSPFTPQSPPFIRTGYAPPNRWDPRGMSHHHPHPILPTNPHSNLQQGPPFIPPSVTPLSQIQGNSAMFSRPIPPPSISSKPPPPPNIAPPPPPPPPSNSPPPPPVSDTESSRNSHQQYPWQGILSKSGVHYCTINAQRVDSDICSYSTAVAEPAEWPAKLDMMKRTDLRHVKSTFTSTPPHRREICWLLPSTHSDHKGFNDFVTYLKQRECAGVIKIAGAANVMWARLLFILPYSPETCSMLSIPPNPSLCLIGLIVPKETNSEVA